MRYLDSGRVPWRLIIIQSVIVLGLVAFFTFYLPYHARQSAQQEAAAREQKILALFHGAVEVDSSREVSVPLDGGIVKRHPERLRTSFSPEEAESHLGIPNTNTTDFRGGQHLAWIGTAHKLEAAFDRGRLYCLTLEDRHTGGGVLVYESYDQFHPY